MLLTPTNHSKAFASPSALEASTLEAILTCPQPADSWWSASDFRRYLVGLEAAGGSWEAVPLLTREGTPERLPRANAVYSSHLSKRRSAST